MCLAQFNTSNTESLTQTKKNGKRKTRELFSMKLKNNLYCYFKQTIKQKSCIVTRR